MDRHTGPRRDRQIKIFQDLVPVLVLNPHLFKNDLAFEMRDVIGFPQKKILRHHIPRRKAFRHDLPSERHVLDLVVVEQEFLPGRGDVLIRPQGRHKRTHRDLTDDRQITAHSVKEKRRQLRDEVIEKLHKKLLLIDPKPDLEQPPQPGGELRQPIAHTAIGPKIANPRRSFPDFRGEMPNFLDPVFVQKVDLTLQHRDQPSLERYQRNRRQPKPNALCKKKYQNGQHIACLEHRLRDRVPHQPTHRLGLGRDHGDQFALARGAEIGLRKPHHPCDQLEPKPPEHPFGQHALHRVEPHLDDPVGKDRCQEGKTEDQQELDLGKGDPKVANIRRLRPDRIIDDDLRQLQRCIEERERRHRHQQKDKLLAFRILPDEAE